MNEPKTWMRVLTIELTSDILHKKIIFGDRWKKEEEDFTISVTGTKYLSALKDRCTVKICNLTYKEIVNIISGQYYKIEVKCGYRNGNIFTIFKGGILYISNVLGDRKSNDVVILCSSEVVAKFGQKRMNLSFSSGINLYSAISFICKASGMNQKEIYIDEDFKNRFLQESEIASSTITSYLDTLCSTNSFLINTDYSSSSQLAIWNPYRKDLRHIVLKSTTIILTQGYPKLDSDGLKIAVMPTFGFCPGDTIQIDNSIIDIGVESEQEAYQQLGRFLDKDGNYIIQQIDFDLENRGSSFSFNIKGKAKSLWNKLGRK